MVLCESASRVKRTSPGLSSAITPVNGNVSAEDPLTEGEFMKFTDVTPNLIVSDIDRSLAFYRDVLGFSLVTTVPDAAPFVFAWLKRDEVNVFLNSVGSVKDSLPDLAARPIGGTNTLFVVVEAGTTAEGIDALFDSVRRRRAS